MTNPITPTAAQLKELAETGRYVERMKCDPQPEIYRIKELNSYYLSLHTSKWPENLKSVGVWHGTELAEHSPFGATGDTFAVDGLTLRQTVTLERDGDWYWVRKMEVVK